MAWTAIVLLAINKGATIMGLFLWVLCGASQSTGL
jgi:hypothetical protein